MDHCGKFIKGKPTMEELRKLFIGQFQPLDFKHIYFKPFIDIGPYTMKVMKRTPILNPKARNIYVPIWILIHKLPGTCLDGISYLNWYNLSGNVAKIKVEIDLPRPKQEEIWLDIKDRMDLKMENGRKLNMKMLLVTALMRTRGHNRKKGKQNRKCLWSGHGEPNTHDQKKNFTSCGRERKNATNKTTNNVVIGEQQQRTEKGETSRLQEEKQDQNKGEKILDEETHTSAINTRRKRMILQKRTNIRAINKKTRMTTKRLIGMIKPIQDE
ncbi:hypothetical protein H5410_006699 [Solanum commersonii]|uniref:DUF4283 domain-containing protein n=1 Tax=Solanum commersonii TaxID=4109 RepID=A0A9J6AAI3_SOLCO|nr:hypothetical protein H5410_006699 [Solanum commersonii]